MYAIKAIYLFLPRYKDIETQDKQRLFCSKFGAQARLVGSLSRMLHSIRFVNDMKVIIIIIHSTAIFEHVYRDCGRPVE